MEKSVPEALFTTDSTERGPGNAVDTGAASAERRSLRRKAHPTTVSNIEELLSMGSSLSESRVSVFPRFPGSKGLSGTPSPAGSRRQPKCVVDSITEGSLASLPKSFKPTRFARSRATRRRRVGSSLPWCTTPIEAESSLGPDSHHSIISLSGIPSAVIVLRILHPILASTLCAATPSCAKTRPF